MREGWGLTKKEDKNGTELWATDGSSTIFKIDPKNFKDYKKL